MMIPHMETYSHIQETLKEPLKEPEMADPKPAT